MAHRIATRFSALRAFAGIPPYAFIVVAKKTQGGLAVNSTVKLTHLDEDLIKSIASEFIINADIIVRQDITEDQLIDVFSKNKIYVPAMVIINKKDLVDDHMLRNTLNKLKQKNLDVLTISAKSGEGIDQLKEEIFSRLKLIRIFMKPVGKKADFNEPLILRKGAKVEDACRKLHRDFLRKFRYASVSGPSAKHDVQKVGLEHILADEDILTIVTWH